MNIKRYSGLAALAIALTSGAQTTINFEDNSQYKAIGVYDSWQQSPFRTGELKGNVKVITNELTGTDAVTGITPNASASMLAFQRSRHAGNLYGARIDLVTPIALSPTAKYAHVLIHKEKEGRVMLIGLGKRSDRAGQKETEQFCVLSTNSVKTGKWYDAVFPISGAEGVEVHALVVVPDCESTHDLSADFAAYFDEIEITSSPTPRISYDFYPVNFDKENVLSRSDRYTNTIGLTSPSDGTQSIDVGQQSSKKVYIERLDKAFAAKAGEKVAPSVNYTPGTWMHSYIYLDRNSDGKFSFELGEDGSIPAGSDIMSYSYCDGKNSAGKTGVEAGASIQPPVFTVPADLPNGFYRLRYKVDWNCIDAGGNYSEGNLITANGGVVVDTRMNIHGDKVKIWRATAENGGGLNGDILKADGSEFTTDEIPFGQPYTIKALPAPGFKLSHVVIRHGHNLEGDSLVYDTPQYSDVTIPAYMFKDNTFVIPAAYIDGDVRLIPYFSSDGGGNGDNDNPGEDYITNFDKETLLNGREDRVLKSFKLVATQGGTTTLTVPATAKHVYRDLTAKEVSVVPGDDVELTITYTGNAMHAYLYIDYSQDGVFDAMLTPNGTPAIGSEVVSYTYYNGHNSLGETIADPAQALSTVPSFTIPGILPNGVYRARLKIDWDNIDPAGQWSENGTNQINENGGYVVDFLINVHSPKHKLAVNTVNGSINGAGNAGLPELIECFKALTVSPTGAATGYKADSITIRHGHNLDGPQYIHGNRQWSEYKKKTASSITIPKDSINGDVILSADFKPNSLATYELVFSDEFDIKDGSMPDATKWIRCDRSSPTWKRFLSNSKEQHKLTGYIEDGKFVARCLPNPFKATDPVDMISGGICTRGKYSFQYGKIEGRLKTEPYAGNFPAFWMMPQENKFGGWPLSGEIDIWEQIDAQNISHHTIHSKWGNTLGQSNNPVKTGNLNGVTNGNYHTFGFEWTEKLLTWYVDGKKVFSYAKSTKQSDLDNGQWPFDEEFYIILNQSVGDGSWAARADINHTYTTLFDWVRVYQKQDPASGIEEVTGTAGIDIMLYPSTIRIAAPDATKVTITDLSGCLLYAETVQGNKNFKIQQGIYVVNGQKVLVP